MIDLSDVKASSALQDKQKDALANYRMAKVLRNGDFLGKNEFDDIFLLSQTNRPRREIYPLQESNILQAIQCIQDHNQMYQVFPFDNRMTWIGDIVPNNKSEIYCVTLLNCAVKHIIRPLIEVNINNSEKYLSVDNLWVKDNALYLFLKNKGNTKIMLKTENVRQNKRFYRVNETKECNEIAIIKKIGQIFWIIFNKNDDEKSTIKRQSFKEIIISMRKGQLCFEQLQNIMNDKQAIKKFMASKKKHGGNTPRRILYETLEQTQKCKDTIESIYERLQNIPISMGRPLKGMIFSMDKRYKAQTISTDPKQKKVDKNVVFSSIESDVPPSFSKTRRFKKMSLFSNSRSRSRGFSHSIRSNNQNNQSSNKKYFSNRYEEQPKNFSFAKQSKEETPVKLFEPMINTLSHKKKNVRLREIFDQMSKDALRDSKLLKVNQKSQQKALRRYKQSISTQKQDLSHKIDDEKFRSALKQKKNQYTKQMAQYFIKAQELYYNSKIKTRIYATGNTERFNQWEKASQRSIIAMNNQTVREQNFEKKVQNQDLFIDKTTKNQEVLKVLNEEKMFESRFEQSSEGNRSRIIDSGAKNKGKKNRFDDEHFGESAQKQFEKSSIASPPRQKTKPRVITEERSKSDISNNDDLEINLPQKSKMAPPKNAQKLPEKSQSEVQLPSFAHFNAKITPDTKLQPPSTTQVKQQNPIKKQTSLKQSKQPTEKTVKEQKPKVVESTDNLKQQISKEMPLKALTKQNENFYDKVQLNLFNEAPSPQDYVYTSKITPQPPKTNEIQEQQKQLTAPNKPPVKKENKPKIKGVTKYSDFNDQIEEVSLGVKQQKPKNQEQKNIPQKKPPTQPSQISEIVLEKPKNPKIQAKEDSIKDRQKSNQSNASSNGQRSVKKLIDQYIFMINKMGEAVAKTAKLSKKLEKIEWYVGVYFLYKRFYYERKKIQRYLQESIPKLTRYEEFSPQEWNQWLSKSDRQTLLAKCKQDNANIQTSLKKMVKKVEIKQLPSRVLLNANISKNNIESTKIAVEYVVDQYDQAVELSLLNDPEILTHLCQMINALYVIAELDGRIKEKRKIIEFTRLNRTKEELDTMVQVVFDLYEQQ